MKPLPVIFRDEGTWELIKDQRLALLSEQGLEALRQGTLDPTTGGYPLIKTIHKGLASYVSLPADTAEGLPGGGPAEPAGRPGTGSQRIRVGHGAPARRLDDVPLNEIIHSLAYRAAVPLEDADLVLNAERQAIYVPEDGKVPRVVRVLLASPDDEEEDEEEILVTEFGDELWRPYGTSTAGLYLPTVHNWMILASQWSYAELVSRSRIEFTPPGLLEIRAQAADERGWRLTDPADGAHFLKICGPLDAVLVEARSVCEDRLVVAINDALGPGRSLPLADRVRAAAGAVAAWWTAPGLPA